MADTITTERLRLAAASAHWTALDRGSQTVHAAEVVDVPISLAHGGGTFPYTKMTALCGAKTWGPKGSATAEKARLDLVNCSRCMATKAWQARADAPMEETDPKTFDSQSKDANQPKEMPDGRH